MADESKGAEINADGYRVVWKWAPWARFLGARAQLIHEYRAQGQSWEEIARSLSCEATQAQPIGMTPLSTATYLAAVHENEHRPYKRRTVTIELTPDQCVQLIPRALGQMNGSVVYEELLECFTETEPAKEPR